MLLENFDKKYLDECLNIWNEDVGFIFPISKAMFEEKTVGCRYYSNAASFVIKDNDKIKVLFDKLKFKIRIKENKHQYSYNPAIIGKTVKSIFCQKCHEIFYTQISDYCRNKESAYNCTPIKLRHLRRIKL